MSIQEIELAITQLSPSDVKQIAAWLENYCEHSTPVVDAAPPTQARPRTLADAMGSMLGAVGRDQLGSPTSSRDAGQSFTDYLVDKNRERRQ